MKNRKKVAKTQVRSSAKRVAAKRRSSKRARPWHKRLALHPASVLLLLCVGVLLAGVTLHGSADSYTVNATVPAVLPPSPAVITSPADQTRFTSRPIDVKGTCPQNTYVKLFRNGVFSGVAICGVGQTTFSIETDLSLGSNVLLPQVFNVTDQPGPPSSPITVYLDNPPSPAPAASTPVQAPSGGLPVLLLPTKVALAPFFVSADFHYVAHVSGQSFNLLLGLSGGNAPYAVTVQWGDGTQSTFLRKDGSKFAAAHTYILSNVGQKTFLARVEAVDSDGAAAFVQIAELVHAKDPLITLPVVGDIGVNTPPLSHLKQWARFIWPAYGVTSVMVLSFWLGERQEYYNIFRRGAIRRRRA